MMNIPLPRAFGCLAFIAMLQLNNSYAQTCPGGGAQLLQTNTVTRIGNANTAYTLAQFDPNVGTLYSVDLSAKVYMWYSYTLTNTSAVPEVYTMQSLRQDSIYVHTPSNPTPMALETNFSPDVFMAFIFHKTSNGTGVPVGVTNYNNIPWPGWTPRTYSQSFNQGIVPFMGADSLYITYKAITEAFDGGSPNVTVSNKSAKDSTVFTIRYHYCPTITLPSKSLTIGSKSQNSNVVISWFNEDRYDEGYFELLKSTDGRTYKSINRQPIDKNNTADYSYLYQPVSTDGTTGFFRIRQTNKSGEVLYSKVVTVVLPKKNSIISTPASSNLLTIFPTVASSSVNISLPDGNNNDEWQVSVLSLSGQVLQTSVIKGNGQARLTFNNPLPNGMHIVNAINKRTNASYKGKIIVQH